MALYHYCIIYKLKHDQAKTNGVITRDNTLQNDQEYWELVKTLRIDYNLEDDDYMVLLSLSLISS